MYCEFFPLYTAHRKFLLVLHFSLSPLLHKNLYLLHIFFCIIIKTTFCLAVDEGSMDVGPLLCILWCGWHRMLVPHLPQWSWVVLPSAALAKSVSSCPFFQPIAQDTGKACCFWIDLRLWPIYQSAFLLKLAFSFNSNRHGQPSTEKHVLEHLFLEKL